MKLHSILCYFLILCALLQIEAYRLGDRFDTEVALDSQPSMDVMRNQMPRFGIDSRANFVVNASRVQLSFEDGLWGMPSVSLANGNLVSIIVRFVYSRVGSATVQAIHSEPTYLATPVSEKRKSSTKHSFIIEYIWLEEPAVNPAAGQAIMFLVVFVASVFLLMSSCGILDSTDSTEENVFSTDTFSKFE